MTSTLWFFFSLFAGVVSAYCWSYWSPSCWLDDQSSSAVLSNFHTSLALSSISLIVRYLFVAEGRRRWKTVMHFFFLSSGLSKVLCRDWVMVPVLVIVRSSSVVHFQEMTHSRPWQLSWSLAETYLCEATKSDFSVGILNPEFVFFRCWFLIRKAWGRGFGSIKCNLLCILTLRWPTSGENDERLTAAVVPPRWLRGYFKN